MKKKSLIIFDTCISILILFCLCINSITSRNSISCTNLNCENKDGSYNFVAGTEYQEKFAGETVTIDLGIENIEMGEFGVNCIVGYIQYNDSIFDEFNIEGVNGWVYEQNQSKNHEMYGKFILYTMKAGIKQDENVAKITLKLKTNLEPQLTEIKFLELQSGEGESNIVGGEERSIIKIVSREPGSTQTDDTIDQEELTTSDKNSEEQDRTEKIAGKDGNIQNTTKTGDTITFIVIALIIATTVINILVVAKNKNNKKLAIIISSAIVMVVAISALCVRAFAHNDDIAGLINRHNQNESWLNSEEYLVTDDSVSMVLPLTEVKDFKNNFNKKVEVYKKNSNEVVIDENVRTGMEIHCENETKGISVVGDVSGDGESNHVDLAKIIRNAVNEDKFAFCDLEKLSADMNFDEIIDEDDVRALVKYILYGDIVVDKVEQVSGPKIEIISGTYNETIDAYENQIDIRIAKHDEKAIKTKYKIDGTEQKEYTELEDGEVIHISNNGVYRISAYNYGSLGNRSEIVCEIIVKKNPINDYKVKTRKENADGTYEETVETKQGRIGMSVSEEIDLPEGYELNTEESILEGTIKEDEITELVVTMDRKSYELTVNAGNYISAVKIGNEQGETTISKSIKYGKMVNITADVIEEIGFTTNFYKWISSNSAVMSDITDKDAEFEMPMSNIELTATANRDVYTVEYYYQYNGEYRNEADSFKKKNGETGSLVGIDENDEIPTKEGYVFDASKNDDLEGIVSGDGNLVLKVYFKQQFTVTYKSGIHGYFNIGGEQVNEDKHENLDYNSDTPVLTGEIVAETGYTFVEWSEDVADKVTENKTYTAVWTANELTFTGTTFEDGIYGTAYTSGAFNEVSGGSGSYTYVIKSGAPDGASIDAENRKISFVNTTPAGTYNVVVTVTDTTTEKTADATFVITINKQTITAVTDLAVATDGTITWTNSSNATDYEISFDGETYVSTTNGANYLDEIIASTGTKTISVKAINSDTANFELINTSIASADVTVYTLSVGSNNTSYGTVDTTSYNVISGVTYVTEDNKLKVKSGEKLLKTITATKLDRTGYTTALDRWSSENGTMSEDTRIMANFTRTANTYTIHFNNNSGTGTMTDQIMTYDAEGALTVNEFSKEGYTFKGWATNEDGDVEYTDGQNVSNLATTGTYNLWAVWRDETGPSLTVSNTGDINKTATKNVIITVADNGSGLAEENSYQYYLSSSDSELTGGAWITYTSGTEFTIGADLNGDYYLFVKQISDVANNKSTAEGSSENIIEETKYHRFGVYKFLQTYTISYALNGDDVVVENPTTYTRESEAIILNEPTRTGYSFTGWTGSNGDTPEVTVTIPAGSTGDKSYTANWTANELIFTGTTFEDGIYGTAYTSGAFNEVSGGSGSYTYVIKSGAPDGASIDAENRKISFVNTTPAGTYNVVVTVTDTTTEKTADATFVITINKQTITAVTDLAVATDGTITWTNSSNATDYEISFDGETYVSTTNGANYLDEIIASTGTKTISVKAINSDTANFELINTSIASADVTVYTLSVGSNNTSYGTVDTTSYNVISGVTYVTEDNKLKVKSGEKLLKTITATKLDRTGYTTAFDKWSSESGTISEDTSIAVNFTRIANTYTVHFNNNGGTGTMADETMTYDAEKALTANEFSKEGYKFKGWATSEDGDVEYTDGQNVSNLATTGTYNLWAVWEDETNSTITISLAEDTNKTATKNITITASDNESGLSTENSYQYYLSESSSALSGGEWKSYTSGTEFTIGSGLNGEYYLFVKLVSDIAGNTSISAESTDTVVEGISYHRFGVYKFLQTYSISYNLAGGSVDPENPISYTCESDAITLNNPTKAGYTFAGWTGSNGETPQENVTIPAGSTGNKSYIATWEKLECTKYAVQIYGINQDVDAEGNALGLTFGPAVGADYNNSYVTHEYEETSEGSGEYYVKIVTHNVVADGTETSSVEYLYKNGGKTEKVTRTTAEKEKYDINMHEMTWAEIKAVSDKTAFTDCMLCGDTKSVNLILNSTISDGSKYNQNGDGAGTLYGSIYSYYKKWNPNNIENTAAINAGSDGSNAMNAGGYRTSHIRATLIGADVSNPDIRYAGDVNLSSSTSLYSCIESDLQNVITAKKVKYTTGTSTIDYRINDDIADSIWLFSDRELYGTGRYSGDEAEGIGVNGDGYDKFGNTNSKYYTPSYSRDFTGINRNGQCYQEDGAGNISGWWLRSINFNYSFYSMDMRMSDYIEYDYVSGGFGISFGFCIQ